MTRPYEALTILAIVVLNGVLGHLQERRAEQALAALEALSAPVARELFVRNARPRPARWSAASVSPAPGLRTLPFQTQPSRSKTKPRIPASTAGGTRASRPRPSA